MTVDSESQPTVDTSATQLEESESPDEADEAYVKDDGTVVLAYNESSDESTTGHLGANISSGLMHLFMNDTSEDDSLENASGNASFMLTPDKMSGSGDMLADKPDEIDELSLTMESFNTRENSNASVDLSATVSSDEMEEGTSQFESMTTEGFVETTGTQFRSEGSAEFSFKSSDDTPLDEMSASITLAEQDDSYTLDVAREYQVSERAVQQWATEEKAKQTLEMQFSLIGASLDGNISVEVQSHEFDEESRQLDIEYTVTFTGVDEMVSEQLASALAESEDLNLDESESEELAEQIQELEITKVSASVESTGDSASAEWEVQIDNYDKALLGVLEITNAMDSPEEETGESFDESINKSRARIEAQREAELTRTAEWEAEVTTDEETLTVEMSVEQTTENWEAYVAEIDDRESLSMDSDSTFRFEAETKNGTIEAEGSFEVSQDGLIESSLDSLTQQMGTTDETAGMEAIETFQRSGFERANMDVSMNGETVTVEGAAKFDNASALRDVFSEQYETNGTLQSLYTDVNESEQTTYIRITDAVSEDPTESEVRELNLVGEDSRIHLPGEWDEENKEFGEIDEQRVQTLLEEESGNGAGMNMKLIVGAGAIFAVIAGALLVLGRRL